MTMSAAIVEAQLLGRSQDGVGRAANSNSSAKGSWDFPLVLGLGLGWASSVSGIEVSSSPTLQFSSPSFVGTAHFWAVFLGIAWSDCVPRSGCALSPPPPSSVLLNQKSVP